MSDTTQVIADRGRLVVICGPMFSGKTARLIELLEAAELRRLSAVAIRPEIDSRHAEPALVSHDGQRHAAYVATSAADVVELAKSAEFVAIDEGQFFSFELVPAVRATRSAGALVIVAGLDRDFRALPFEPMPHLVDVADRVEMLTASCAVCGRSAAYSQRLINGRPAPWHDPTIRVGSTDLYEPRCGDCFEPPARAASA